MPQVSNEELLRALESYRTHREVQKHLGVSRRWMERRITELKRAGLIPSQSGRKPSLSFRVDPEIKKRIYESAHLLGATPNRLIEQTLRNTYCGNAVTVCTEIRTQLRRLEAQRQQGQLSAPEINAVSMLVKDLAQLSEARVA